VAASQRKSLRRFSKSLAKRCSIWLLALIMVRTFGEVEYLVVSFSTIAVDKFVENLKIEWISHAFIITFLVQTNFEPENNI